MGIIWPHNDPWIAVKNPVILYANSTNHQEKVTCVNEPKPVKEHGNYDLSLFLTTTMWKLELEDILHEPEEFIQ
jgi:hypothetical protein